MALVATAGGSARAADLPMTYLRTFGPAGDPVTWLDIGMIVLSLVVCAIIAALVLMSIFHRRPPARLDAQGRGLIGPDRGGLRWITIGVGISTLVLLAFAVWILTVLSAVAAPSHPPALTVEVVGRQWWWEVRYIGGAPADTIATANEIHIPVGQPVRFQLIGGDVIHSFWIPQLGGKTDMIPGQTNVTWLQADKPGDYRGQCGEYCGLQHAHMAMHVMAEEPAKFEAWRRQQLQEAAAPPPSAAQAVHGGQVFMQSCAACHAVRGTDAGGRLGPDLTHLMSRGTIAGGTLDNTRGNLAGWVANPQSMKPGARMPAMDLTPQDLRAVVAYLETLK
ncbi:MAG: cytochrome c oxidase subunit II [Burkholderiaceae bacterium]